MNEVDMHRAFLRVPLFTHAELDITHDKLLLLRDTLKIDQIQTLEYIYRRHKRGYNRLLLNLKVGTGKSLISMLIPYVTNFERPMVIIPPSNFNSYIGELCKWVMAIDWLQWKPTLVTASAISSKRQKDILEANKPDCIIIDEAQMFKTEFSARTKRLRYYLNENPDCAVYLMSGTLISDKIHEYSHLTSMLFRDKSPLPVDIRNINTVQAMYDMTEGIKEDAAVLPIIEAYDKKFGIDSPDTILSVRLRNHAGILFNKKKDDLPPLHIVHLDTPDPQANEHMGKLLETWTDPDGSELVSASDIHLQLLYMSIGKYFKRIPNNMFRYEEFLEKRRIWGRILREQIKNTTDLDTVSEVEFAVKCGRALPSVIKAYRDYEEVAREVSVHTEMCTLFDVDNESIQTAINMPEGLVWCVHRLHAYLLKVKVGCDALDGDRKSPDTDVAKYILSVLAYGKGFNLQRWNTSILMEPLGSPLLMEQLIGRTHRHGQKREVTLYLNSTNFYFKSKFDKLLDKLERFITLCR